MFNYDVILLYTTTSYVLIRLIYLLLNKPKRTLSVFPMFSRKHSTKPLVWIILGSGGHTTEMLKLTNGIYDDLNILFILSSNDKISHKKVQQFTNASIYKIPRSRKVGQSYATSVYTTILSIIYCIPLFFTFDLPDMIICNGPGVCIPVCLLGYLMRVFHVKHISIVFVESLARVYKLSLSGKILYYISDRFIVQWPYLKPAMNDRIEYYGRLV